MLNRSIPNKYRPAMDRSKRLFQSALSRSTSPLEEDIIETELNNIGVENIEQYLKLMEPQGPMEPWIDLVMSKYDIKESDSSDCLKFFCLGRFHEIATSFKEEIRSRRGRSESRPISETSVATGRERKRARDCDKGSSGSSYVDPPDLSRHIERVEPYLSRSSTRPAPKRRRTVIPETPFEDLIKESSLSNKAINCTTARMRLFDVACYFRNHSGFMKSAKRAGLPMETARKHLWGAASATVRSEKNNPFLLSAHRRISQILTEQRDRP